MAIIVNEEDIQEIIDDLEDCWYCECGDRSLSDISNRLRSLLAP